MNTTRFAVMLGIATAGFLATPSPARAQLTLGACVNNNNGNLHLASGPSDCKGQEVFVQWNVQGVPGPTGPTGLQGPQGIQGPTGAKGDQGLMGATGIQGPTGLQGIPGTMGPTGIQGIQGIQGPTGLQGIQGPIGPTGMTGSIGIQGIQGIQGATGLQGIQGPTGAAGKDGAGLVNGTIAGQLLRWDGSNSWVAALPLTTPTTIDNMQPFNTVSYIISLYGIFPSRNGADPFVGEIELFAGNFAPQGFAFCDGQLLSIAQNTALFSILGTMYGGNGQTTFGLPDLRGRVPIHAGQGPGLTGRTQGEMGGAETRTLTLHTHPQ